MIGQPQQLAVHAVVELLGEPKLGAGAEEVGAADAPREERVAGEHEPRLRGATAVRHEDRQAVGRVAGGMQERHADVPHLVLLVVLDGDVRKLDRRRAVHEDGGTGGGGQPARARDVVGLHVGLDDVGHPHGLLARGLQVRLDLELWIHHSARSGAASPEQIAGAAGLGGEELTEDHRGTSWRERLAALVLRPAPI
jgi:hypothetical protein